MKTFPNQTVSLNSCEIGTLGIVVDLHDAEGRNLAQETIRRTGDLEFKNLVSMAHGLEKKYIIAAGKFNGRGIFGIFCDDDDHLIAAFEMVNARMEEIGSRTTGWVIKPDACADLLGKASLQSTQKGGV